jgi:WXG100 family type VII secretion target
MMTSSINWNFGDLARHAGTIGGSAASLSEVHRAIMADVAACADFWGGKGNAAYDAFTTELNRNFAVVFENLDDHGRKVTRTTNNTEATDLGIAGSWA